MLIAHLVARRRALDMYGFASAVILCMCVAACQAAPTEPDDPRPFTRYVPLAPGQYWLYEVQSSSGASGLKQVLVSDQHNASDQSGALEYVLSIKDSSLPREELPDEPTILRVDRKVGLICLECGGVLLPSNVGAGLEWSAERGVRCTAANLSLGAQSSTVVADASLLVSCHDEAQRITTQRVYAVGVGLVLWISHTASKGALHYRVERLIEHRLLPSANFPSLDPGKKH